MRWLMVSMLIGACSSNTPAGPVNELSEKASFLGAEKICYLLQHGGDECRVSGALVEYGGTTLSVKGVIRFAVDAGGAARNVAFSIHRGDEVILHPVEAMGKGMAEADALERSSQTWAAIAGTAAVDAVRNTGKSDVAMAALKAGRKAGADATAAPAIESANFVVYPGIPNIIGAMEGGPAMDHEAMVTVLTSAVGTLRAGEFHTITLAVRNAGSIACDRVEVNGISKPELCSSLSGYPWPKPAAATGYVLKQVYVYRPSGGPEAVVQ